MLIHLYIMWSWSWCHSYKWSTWPDHFFECRKFPSCQPGRKVSKNHVRPTEYHQLGSLNWFWWYWRLPLIQLIFRETELRRWKSKKLKIQLVSKKMAWRMRESSSSFDSNKYKSITELILMEMKRKRDTKKRAINCIEIEGIDLNVLRNIFFSRK